jgi:hypothetical protein
MDPIKPCLDTDRTHPTVGGAGVEALTVVAQQDRSLAAFTDRQVDGARRAWHQRNARWLVPLADDAQDPVTPFEAKVLDVRPARLTDPQAVQAEQHTQRACIGDVRSAVYRNDASSPRSMPRCAVGWTRGRRTYCAGLEAMRPSM